MGVKRQFTPLSGVDLVDDDQRVRLEKLGVTTVEELVGQLEADPSGMGQLLDLEGETLKQLQIDAQAALPQPTRDAFGATARYSESYGAIRPKQAD